MTVKVKTATKNITEEKWYKSLPCLVEDLTSGNVYYAYRRSLTATEMVDTVLLKKYKGEGSEGMQLTCYMYNTNLVEYQDKLILENE